MQQHSQETSVSDSTCNNQINLEHLVSSLRLLCPNSSVFCVISTGALIVLLLLLLKIHSKLISRMWNVITTPRSITNNTTSKTKLVPVTKQEKAEEEFKLSPTRVEQTINYDEDGAPVYHYNLRKLTRQGNERFF